MFSPEYIRSLQDEAARKAASENLTPYAPTRDEIDAMPPFPFPFVGNYVADGWEPVKGDHEGEVWDGTNQEAWFVDTSGFGAPDEPALTVDQLKDRLRENVGKGYGYALIEIGQFQGYLGVFKYVGRKSKAEKRLAKSAS